MKRSKVKVSPATPDVLRFSGGAPMIVGDYDIYCVCTALIMAYKGAESVPEKKRTPYMRYIMGEWARLLAERQEWMKKVEVENDSL